MPLSDERFDMNIKRFSLFVGSTLWPTCVFAQDNYMGGGRMNGYGYMMNSWGGAFIMGLVVLVVVGILIYVLVRNSGGGGFGATSHETPLDILKKRYARGEITKEQFDQMKEEM